MAAGAGATDVVAAVAGKKIRVLGYVLVASAAGVNPQWLSAANVLSGAMPLPAGGGVAAAPCHPDLNAGWLETNAGEALRLNAAAAGNLTGHLLYQLV